MPRRGATGGAPDHHGGVGRTRRQASGRRRGGSELHLPGDIDAAHREPARRRDDDGARPERQRGGARSAARRRSPGAAELGARPHACGPRIGDPCSGRGGDGSGVTSLRKPTGTRSRGGDKGPMLNAWDRTDGTHPRGARVQVMRMLAIAVLALGASLAVAACGSGGGIESGSGGNANVETVKVSGKPSGDLTISNWPLYIDKQTVPDFEKATGVSVKYIEDVNDNQEFFSKVQPLLSKGESGGRSIVVVTDWMAKKMYDLGYVQNLDKAAIPNVEKNITANLRNRPFDPNNDFAVPWQSGMTGLIVRTDLAPQIKSICDLFNSKYKGKVDMLTE